ncbi:hypothetical protein DNTS_032899 [Danionella cerebrum]|uniref:Transmembrane protein 79 n=1 Tax=Danionella cerebrum TaxID=2873325 RepID=A0A553R5D8_9TELE|nr:hypothetical protein DNTS_032899 [Danionella translucida]
MEICKPPNTSENIPQDNAEEEDWMDVREDGGGQEEDYYGDDDDDDDDSSPTSLVFTTNVMVLQPTEERERRVNQSELNQTEEIQTNRSQMKEIPEVTKHHVNHVQLEQMEMEEIRVEKETQMLKNHLRMNQMQELPLCEQNMSRSRRRFHPCSLCLSERYSVQVMRLCVCVAAAAMIFPLVSWGGYKLLPFEAPPISSSALRLIYTLRCAFFASLPITLGVLVQGASRLKFGALKPLFDGTLQNREGLVHSYFVRDSLHLFLLFFLQLAVTASFVQQEALKLVPVLTIIFVFGRLIYWVCLVFGSSVRALGFSLSFLPLLVLVGANLYFIGSGSGEEAVFHVAPPTTPPPPKLRWWG